MAWRGPLLVAFVGLGLGLGCMSRSGLFNHDAAAPDVPGGDVAAGGGGGSNGQGGSGGAAGLSGGGGSGSGGAPNTFTKRVQARTARDLDMLFLIDDSQSMAPLQDKLRMRLPDFMNVLKQLPGGLPNIHLAVVSSSLGAGAFGNVPGCAPGSAGNLNGAFQHSPACTQLPPSEHFLSSVVDPVTGNRIDNFTGGDITPVFSCITNLGQQGCGFEHQFEATRLALQKARNPTDPDNAGFLRDGAYLAIVMLTNEDDCSVPANSGLFDPRVFTLSGVASADNPTAAGVALGGLQSYRCNEFGHVCDGPNMIPPPHNPPATTLTLNNCVSAEDGPLLSVAGFIQFVKSLKADPSHILVAALAGPATPYTIQPHLFNLADATTETQPQMVHSCMQTAGEYADPAIRIKQWLDAFGGNAVFESICAADFLGALVRIAQVVGRTITDACVPRNIAAKSDGTPSCVVLQTAVGGSSVPTQIPFCASGRPLVPCWELAAAAQCSGATQQFRVCYDAVCSDATSPVSPVDTTVTCALVP